MTDATAKPVIFTLGHSRHPIGDFVALLERHGVRRVVDVRGQPFSRFNPQFNRECLRQSLEEAGIAYAWRGDRLSGRPKEREFYGFDGKVLWERLRAWPELHAALEGVAETAKEAPTALVCAEEDPRRCHRRFLLTAPLVDLGLEVLHISGDGTVEREDDLTKETNLGRAQLNLFQ